MVSYKVFRRTYKIPAFAQTRTNHYVLYIHFIELQCSLTGFAGGNGGWRKRRMAAKQPVQRNAANPVHGDEELALVHTQIVRRDQIGVVEHGAHTGLGQEVGLGTFGCMLCPNHLQRHVLSRSGPSG